MTHETAKQLERILVCCILVLIMIATFGSLMTVAEITDKQKQHQDAMQSCMNDGVSRWRCEVLLQPKQ